jgi:hypothetical protein
MKFRQPPQMSVELSAQLRCRLCLRCGIVVQLREAAAYDIVSHGSSTLTLTPVSAEALDHFSKNCLGALVEA